MCGHCTNYGEVCMRRCGSTSSHGVTEVAHERFDVLETVEQRNEHILTKLMRTWQDVPIQVVVQQLDSPCLQPPRRLLRDRDEHGWVRFA